MGQQVAGCAVSARESVKPCVGVGGGTVGSRACVAVTRSVGECYIFLLLASPAFASLLATSGSTSEAVMMWRDVRLTDGTGVAAKPNIYFIPPRIK